MEDLLNFENITALIFLIIYGTIFFIQRAQFKKQKEVLEKYERIFDIINIDEIEKYVKLKQKSLELSYSNRETELKNMEIKYADTFNEVETILNGSKSSLEKTEEIRNTLHSVLEKNNLFVNNLMEINIQEFDKIHQTLMENLDNVKDKKTKDKINRELKRVSKEHNSLRKKELEKLQ